MGNSAAGWSPDAQQLAYGYYDNGIYKINADGSGWMPIGGAGRWNEYPRWSPDGQEIVFSADLSYSNNTLQLYLVGADGTGQHALPGTVTTLCAGFMSPSWSPNGTRIAFVSDDGVFCGPAGSAEVWTVNRDGTGAARLTPADPADVVSFTWSPDGTKLAYDRYTSGNNSNIYVLDSDGTGQVPLTNADGVDANPDWQPAGAMTPFPRPGGGSPLITYLVTAYERCTAPNTEHVAPLAEGSCTPPVQVSNLLTNSKTGVGKGFVRLDAIPGNPVTGADEADVRIESLTTDVRNASDQSDYAGQVLLSSVLRITDRASGFGGVSATVSDFRFDVPVSCTPTAVAPRGSRLPDPRPAPTHWSRAWWPKESVRSSPPTTSSCWTPEPTATSRPPPAAHPLAAPGDEETYLEQGTFTP